MTTTADAAAKWSEDMCVGRMKMVKLRMRELAASVIHYAHAISLQITTGNSIWTKLRLVTGI